MHHLKKSSPQVCLMSQGRKRLSCFLNNHEFMVHYVPIYRKHPKDLKEEK